ncbi:glycosyltransferase family 2 protein [Aestuariibaculum sp. YM273]|uniref:glycosyltransferase family 2 protein n=1 Tax=Aestuariibaculum sp. YM273 TaxID=3070659 RepID=UPI0027DE1981|nr:glycosyltransferase family 2 protein [Aestuariibaculum sp. YM273]WMI66620.1 glycosyltransferase family 2 protein [Aestuariibaculum sp. YM273]
MKGLVSIITPSYNSAKFISETIESVQSQTYTNWELIIVNDASSDNTIELLREYIHKDSRIKLLQLKTNSGPAIARNKGIDEAKGDYIAFLDADDIWKPNKLEKQISFMQVENCDVCFSDYDLINDQGVHLNKRIKALPKVSYNTLLKSNYIGNLTGIYNAEVLGKIKSPNLRKRQDWLLWINAVKSSGKDAIGINESLAYYRVHKNSMSFNKFHLLKHNFLVYKKGLGFSVFKSCKYMILFLFEHFFVKSKLVVAIKKI